MTIDSAATRRLAVAGIVALLTIFAASSWHAAAQESPTFDEPVHTISGLLSLQLHDHRLDPEAPLLWKLWASLPSLFAPPIEVQTASPSWDAMFEQPQMEWVVANATLYGQPHDTADAIIARARFMMLLLGVLLGGLIALWAWRVGGPVAAATSTLLFAFDPNFLAHASLVTSDVPAALTFCAVAFATWRVGQDATPARLIALLLSVPVGVLVKQSALLTIPIAALLLMIRALGPAPWRVAGRELHTLTAKVGAIAAIGTAMSLTTFAGIWLCYGLRFAPTPDPTAHFNMDASVFRELENTFIAETGQRHPTALEVAGRPLSAFMDVMITLSRYQVLPEAFVNGLMHAHADAIVRRTFLLGNVGLVGHWYYFPVALLVKTPIATLIAVLASFAFFVQPWQRRLAQLTDAGRGWDWLCLVVPPVAYLAVALGSNLNLGIRHVFPVYPFLFVGAGLGLVSALRARPRLARWAAVALGAMLITESVGAAPYYLPFFNVSAGGWRGGLELLGDSNLDWGQGLKLLARWQHEHGDPMIYLGYAGSIDPKKYGIRFVSLIDPEPVAKQPELVAIGASMLQGITVSASAKLGMDAIRATQEPIEVLGGCIYLYRSADVLPILSRFKG